MIGAIDLDQFLRLLHLRVELAHGTQRNQLVALAVDDELRLGRRLDAIRERPFVDRWGDADERTDAIVVGARAHGDIRAEREPGRPQLLAWILRCEEIDGGAEIVHLAAPFVPRPGAATDA